MIRYDATTNLLNGNDSLTMVGGVYPLSLLVQNTGNKIVGIGGIVGLTTLQDSNAQLTVALDGQFINPIVLNNGALTLASDLSLGNGNVINGPGTVTLGTSHLLLGAQDMTWLTDINWVSTIGVIDLRSKVTLSSTWTFNGNCTIDGHGNTLDINDLGRIVIGSNSTLILRDIRVEEITGTDISCVDDTGKIILDNVVWSQNGNAIFDKGSLQFKNKVRMQGKVSLAYQSSQTSTILMDSSLKLDKGFTFSYDPIYLFSKDLIEFIDDSSELILNNASLHVTVTGINLKRGTLGIRGNSTISSEIEIVDMGELGITIIDDGIVLGDGLNSANDFTCEIDAGARLKLNQGSFSYKNLLASSWQMINNTSEFLIAADAVLKVFQTITTGPGIIKFDDQSVLGRVNNKNIVGSIKTNGKRNTINLISI